MQVYTALKKWELMQTVAKRMALLDPDDPQAGKTGRVAALTYSHR